MIALILATAGCGSPDPDVAVPTIWVAPLAPSPLRRLTSGQIRNALADLFPGVPLPEDAIPADPKVGGFTNMATAQVPSLLWIEGVQGLLLQMTASAMLEPEGWLPCPADGGSDPTGCGQDTLVDLGSRAFRRPLTADERDLYLGFFSSQLDETGAFSVALQLALQALLSSPPFLYLLEPGPDPVDVGPRVALGPYEMATRLSFTLWNGLPDDLLMDAAAADRLRTPDQIEGEAWRMMADPRFARGIETFHLEWLDIDNMEDKVPVRSTQRYPDWSPAQRDDAVAETRDLVWSVWQGPTPTLASLLLDPSTTAEGGLADLYGIDAGSDTIAGDRVGILTRGAWLTSTGHLAQPSPVQRGVWVLDRLLCVPPPPPPPNVDVSIDDLQGQSASNRDQYEAHVSDPACASCHISIDGIGFGFEHFDSIGGWIPDEPVPIDATGELVVGDLAGQTFDGATELSQLLATSPDAHDCVARHWWRYALGRFEVEEDTAVLDPLSGSLWALGGDLPTLVVEVVRSETFRTRRAIGP